MSKPHTGFSNEKQDVFISWFYLNKTGEEKVPTTPRDCEKVITQGSWWHQLV